MLRIRLKMGLAVLAVRSMGMASGDCEAKGCTPTTTKADTADKVDLTAMGKSFKLTAKLTVASSGEALGGKIMTFRVYDSRDSTDFRVLKAPAGVTVRSP